jgi:serine/threonine protein kinase
LIGKTIAHYRVTEKIGAGGMGEVYQATDTKLNREVALKILPEAFSTDADRMARFSREAQTLASLNHPNIAAIYGLEEGEGVRALVLELVGGLTLAERIKQGAVPLDEALSITRQIAEALETAHDQGIIHRDLKPANVKVTDDGMVKVLDFGLAKALDDPGSDSDMDNSPTLSVAATKAGIILGTAAYMAPEQAKGKKVDRRGDVWAFGVVLYEMLTGKRLFSGENISETLAAVIMTQPDWEVLPEETPAQIRKLLRRCLEKDPKKRLQAIGEARIALTEYEEEASGASVLMSAAIAPEVPVWKQWMPWAVAGVFTLTTLVLGVLVANYASQEVQVVRAEIPPPTGASFHLLSTRPGPVAISPNGKMLAFAAQDEEDGQVRLFVRQIDAAQAHVLTGTEGAVYPFWSPDSRSIAFFSDDNKLKKIEASGGPPLTLCDASNGKGGTWNRDGTILFAPSHDAVIHRVSAAGGEPTPITEFNTERSDNSHRHPRFLPDGDHFLYLARVGNATEGNSIMVRSLSDGTEKELVRGPAAASYASGHLLYLRETTLMAHPFDPGALEFTGDAFPIAENVLNLTAGAAHAVFSASDNGILVFQQGEQQGGFSIEWVDRAGRNQEPVGDLAVYQEVSLSPDGRSAAVSVAPDAGGVLDIWLYDLQRGIRSRFTFDSTSDQTPVWSPDNRNIVFSSNRKGNYDLYRKSTVGSGEVELLLEAEGEQFAYSFSPDGRFLSYVSVLPPDGSGAQKIDTWILPLTGDRKPFPFLETEFIEAHARFSPDGRWVAYASDESGRFETYVRPFPGPGRRWQVSTNGGYFPHWRHDGKEIIYTTPAGSVMAAEISARRETFEVGAVEQLFETRPPNPGFERMSPAGNHKKFLSLDFTGDQPDTPLTLVVNWTAEIGKD